MTVKQERPEAEEVFLRSDNAGCYHCGHLWLALNEIKEKTGKGTFLHRFYKQTSLLPKAANIRN